jgi:hypothetical protein
MSLPAAVIQAVNAQVYRRYPEMAGRQPRVQPQAIPKGAPAAGQPVYQLIYRCTVRASSGPALPRVVRVTIDEHGKILKTSTSR